jgi:hypothetical protein
MHTRAWTLGLFVLFTACQAKDDAGIVLNVDTDVTADRAVINRLVVSLDGSPQEWNLNRALPGSLGIRTSSGKKFVTVDGFINAVPRARWTGMVDAPKGSVIVQDVHLASLGFLDGGLADGRAPDAPAMDGYSSDRGPDVASDASADTRGPGDSGAGDGRPSTPDGGSADGSRGDARDATTRDGISAPDGQGFIDASPNDAASLPADPLSGAFAVRSPFDISASAAASGPVRDALNLVHAFAVDPGAAILDYADQAGVTAAAVLRAALPSALMSRLTGWMSTYIKSAGSNGVVPYDRLVWLDDTVRALLLYWTLESRLALPVAATGTHLARALIFADASGSPLTYPLDPALLTAASNVTAALSWPGGVAPAIVTISDHAFALPFGRYALPALDAILLARYGTPDVTAYLADAVGCAGMADYVASQCVSIVCVGHESDVNDLCEGGLAQGAKQIDAQILGIDVKALHLVQGTATAVGAEPANPQKTTAMRNGTWTVTVDFGTGPQPANATFSATAE